MSLPKGGLTIVTPSFEKHFEQYKKMLNSIVKHCTDLPQLRVIVVVEQVNHDMFDGFLSSLPLVHYMIISTESVLADFDVNETPIQFLKRAGKFTFQTVKKFGGLKQAETEWSLVLDSEGLFINQFSAIDILTDYADQKYVFYTPTAPRGPYWNHSTGIQVNQNAGEALSMLSSQRWYMESFHWFYETAKVIDLLAQLNGRFYDVVAGRSAEKKDFFENILYYLYLEKFHSAEYRFLDFKKILDEELPAAIAERFRLEQLPFSLFGNDYLLNIVQPGEVAQLAPLFERFRLPFIRLEPPILHHGYLKELAALPFLKATISSHHNIWLNKKIAVCISGEFRHGIHRTTEQQVRTIKSFLSGVECDLFIHSWSSSSEPLILHELAPRASLFEPRLSLAPMERRIQHHEQNLKPGRDEGSLLMFYGMQKSFELATPFLEEYDYIVRLRPDIFYDRSLKEVLVGISDDGDLLPDCIYVPKSFQSKGTNDQFAIGTVARMQTYFQTFRYLEKNIGTLFFNPEFVLLHNLLSNAIGISLVDLPYALMRSSEFRIGTIAAIMQEQEQVWWSSTSNLPTYCDLSAYFNDKLRAMEATGLQSLPPKLYLTATTEIGGVFEARVVDEKPARDMHFYWQDSGAWDVAPFDIQDGKLWFDEPEVVETFCFPVEDGIMLSQWRFGEHGLANDRLTLHPASVRPSKDDLIDAWNRRDTGEHTIPGASLAMRVDPVVEVAAPVRADHTPSRPPRVFSAATLSTRDGRLVDGLLAGSNGLLFYGPYALFPPGRYTATVHLAGIIGSGKITVEVSTNGGDEILRRTVLAIGPESPATLQLEFDVPGWESMPIEFVGHVANFQHIGISQIVVSDRDRTLTPQRDRSRGVLQRLLG